jgi:hypothetical protein
MKKAEEKIVPECCKNSRNCYLQLTFFIYDFNRDSKEESLSLIEWEKNVLFPGLFDPLCWWMLEKVFETFTTLTVSPSPSVSKIICHGCELFTHESSNSTFAHEIEEIFRYVFGCRRQKNTFSPTAAAETIHFC